MLAMLLITVMCSCALHLLVGEEESHNKRPCQPNNNIKAYERFKTNHILPKKFKTASASAWERHIRGLKRCKEETQTFIKQSNTELVKNVCNGEGWNQQGNLCTSFSEIPVYNVTVITSNCTVPKTPKETNATMTVACDRVDKLCLPVHIQGRPQSGKRRKATCSPAEHLNIPVITG